MNKELVLVFTILIFHQALLGNARHANFGTRALNSRIFMDRMYPVEQIYVEHHVDHHVHIIPCQITCKSVFCEVSTGKIMGSCFLPPYTTTCSGLPPGCGSCVEACGFKANIVPNSNPPPTFITVANAYPVYPGIPWLGMKLEKKFV